MGAIVTPKRKPPPKIVPGFVYAMRFSSGTVKVGRTANLKSRKAQHALGARVHGHRLEETWSTWVDDQHNAEQVVIDAACFVSTDAQPVAVGSREWWRDVDFDQLVGELEFWFGKGSRREETE